ncbi:hypothetical protein BM1_05148 [Bipolaris maydis]|nr:hypothetical protein BM1_05148 [Bipolaris maydis]
MANEAAGVFQSSAFKSNVPPSLRSGPLMIKVRPEHTSQFHKDQQLRLSLVSIQIGLLTQTV